jgi:hypothetical protein
MLVMLALTVVVLVGLGLGPRGTVPAEAKKPSAAAYYVFGKLDGALADELMEILQPVKWQKQTDGLLIMAGESVRRLNGENRRNLLVLRRWPPDRADQCLPGALQPSR